MTGRSSRNYERAGADQESNGRAWQAQEQGEVCGVSSEREAGRQAEEDQGAVIVSIYGLFAPSGACLYVGQSVRPAARFSEHKRARFAEIECAMKILKTCEMNEAHRIEIQTILEYRANGQARMNRSLTFGRPVMAERASEWIQLRATADRKAAYFAAAKRCNQTLSEWCFEHLDAASGYEGDDK